MVVHNNYSMRRTYVTFAQGDLYTALADILVDSIGEFSKYPIVVYNSSDFEEKWEPENWKSGYSYKFKILSCLKALREYDEIVWLDNDIVVTKHIDDIWKHKIENYPLLPRHRFYNFIRWPHYKINYSNPNELFDGKLRVCLNHTDFDGEYYQACAMLLNKNCESFIMDILSYFNDYDNISFPCGDETIINLLLWKYKYRKNLGDIFICSHYFSIYHIIKALSTEDIQEYQDIFNLKIIDQSEDNLFLYGGGDYRLHNRIGIINAGNKLLFTHGSKSKDEHKYILDHLKSIK